MICWCARFTLTSGVSRIVPPMPHFTETLRLEFIRKIGAMTRIYWMAAMNNIRPITLR